MRRVEREGYPNGVLDTMSGAWISTAIREAIEVARETGNVEYMDFSGTIVPVRGTSNVDDIWTVWRMTRVLDRHGIEDRDA